MVVEEKIFIRFHFPDPSSDLCWEQSTVQITTASPEPEKQKPKQATRLEMEIS